jgi:hypothetical protein
MEDAGGIRADAHGQKHVAELRHRRVGEHPLDVVLDQADRSSQKRGRDADRRDDPQRQRCMTEEHGVAPDHIPAVTIVAA